MSVSIIDLENISLPPYIEHVDLLTPEPTPYNNAKNANFNLTNIFFNPISIILICFGLLYFFK